MVDAGLDVGGVATSASSRSRRGGSPPTSTRRRATSPARRRARTRTSRSTSRSTRSRRAVGVDGQGREGEGASAATSTIVGKGHLEQAGRWTGWIDADGVRHELVDARGNRDKSWGPRRWGGPKMWRWFSINIGDDTHFGGIRIGTDAGDLHRGWVWTDGEHSSIKEWKVTSELADDGVTHTATHVHATDKRGRVHELDADVFRVSPGPAGIRPELDDRQRGSRPLDLRRPHRLRHQRVPPPARRQRAPGRPDRVTAGRGVVPPLASGRAATGRVDRVAVHLGIVLAVFPVIFIGELPDKTMFASLVMATRGRPFSVWLGAAARVPRARRDRGDHRRRRCSRSCPQQVVDFVRGVPVRGERGRGVHRGAGGRRPRGGVDRRAPGASRVFATAFVVIFLAEWGDLTQVLTVNRGREVPLGVERRGRRRARAVGGGRRSRSSAVTGCSAGSRRVSCGSRRGWCSRRSRSGSSWSRLR